MKPEISIGLLGHWARIQTWSYVRSMIPWSDTLGRKLALIRVCFPVYSNTASLCQLHADCNFLSLSFIEDQKVSAPDVALYGLHVIIPLMSSEVLKVSPLAPQFSFPCSLFVSFVINN